jgi:hypothetical protein
VRCYHRYTPECTKLLAQYKTTLKLLGDAVPSLDAFCSEYRVRAGRKRLRLPRGLDALSASLMLPYLMLLCSSTALPQSLG